MNISDILGQMKGKADNSFREKIRVKKEIQRIRSEFEYKTSNITDFILSEMDAIENCKISQYYTSNNVEISDENKKILQDVLKDEAQKALEEIEKNIKEIFNIEKKEEVEKEEEPIFKKEVSIEIEKPAQAPAFSPVEIAPNHFAY
jgi:hypothetical protein